MILPLQDKKIIVTRSRKQAKDLTELLKAEGAIVYEIPSIEIVILEQGISKLKEELKRIDQYSWLVLTSVNAAMLMNQILLESGSTWKLFDTTRIACIGKATVGKVTEFGATVSIVPSRFQAESLAQELMKNDLKGQNLLLPRAEGSRPVLPQQLNQAGANVNEIHIYKAQLAQESKDQLKKLISSDQFHFITFTSSSTVRNFAELAGELPWQTIPAACIGPITAGTLREYGVEPAVEAEEFTMQGLVEALVKAV